MFPERNATKSTLETRMRVSEEDFLRIGVL